MYRSSEVRWFFAGVVPPGVREWFVVGDHVRSETARTDEYILLPDCETASVKVREGRLEVKARTAAPEAVTFATDVEGWRDNWIKWSSYTIDDEALRQLVGPADNRMAFVSKQRILRTWSLDGAAPEEVDGAQIRLTNGCQIELTQVSVSSTQSAIPADEESSSAWWSLSFEAFGAHDRITANLEQVAALMFRQPPPVQLPKDASRSYPAWLSKAGAGLADAR